MKKSAAKKSAAPKKSAKKAAPAKKASAKTQAPARAGKSAASGKQDAVALLKADHEKVKGMFEQFENTKSETKKKELAMKICLELTVHTKIEEDVFYPACKDNIEDDLWHEAYVEHDGAKVLIAEIRRDHHGDDFYDAKVKVLSEMIEHHVEEEEKRNEGMFAQAKKAGLDMEALGKRMANEKKILTAKYKAEGLPMPETHSFSGTRLA